MSLDLGLALVPVLLAGFALGYWLRGFRQDVQRAADTAELARLQTALGSPLVQDMMLEKGIRVGARSGKLWTVADAAAALAAVDDVQELAALSDELLPRQEPGLPGIAPLRRGRPPWQELAEREDLLPDHQE